MKTIHLILNAHLDPIWLWSWRDGLDEVLNTSYYICKLLDRHPDIIYTRGEAWLYEQIQNVDPALFVRIQKHVRAGRWSPVGGWYLQPDCNLPSGFALQRQIMLGKERFLKWFGKFPTTAYNVDSFGHAATLPGYMRAARQTSYVMMRPQEGEMNLPARLFRWKGYQNGPEVTTFRIAQSYGTMDGVTEEHLLASISGLPKGTSHTMCFIGIGDHGGGPTESMIDWCRAHRDHFPGWKLVFSSPERFFAAIRRERVVLPLVVGELQQHAVGCYSVHRPIKVALRRAEHRLFQAEHMLGKTARDSEELNRAWKQVCFHHFHDTLGGTCLPSAYADVESQMGEALSIADRLSAVKFRKALTLLPENAAQRMAFFNPSESPFDDYIEIEPWLEWSLWNPSWRIVDEKGRRIAYQTIASESGDPKQIRLLFRMKIGPCERRLFRIVDGKRLKKTECSQASSYRIRASQATAVLKGKTSLLLGDNKFSLPRLALYDDPTDTWSHGIDRYAPLNQRLVHYEKTDDRNQGKVMSSSIRVGTIGASQVSEEWRIYADAPWIDYFLRVDWVEKRSVLKLEWKLSSAIIQREDGIMGGSLKRACDGRELPLRDWISLRIKGSSSLSVAVVAPDVFALDVGERIVRFTLLRSPVMACHDPNPGTHSHSVHSDRGQHYFRFRFLSSFDLPNKYLDQIALGMHRRPLSAEVTRGMVNRFCRGQYAPAAV